jgi:hypothetical protein
MSHALALSPGGHLKQHDDKRAALAMKAQASKAKPSLQAKASRTPKKKAAARKTGRPSKLK